MATPSINDLVRYINTKLTGANWNTNFNKIVNWLTDGNTDLVVKTIETGDVDVTGDLTVTGSVTAPTFIGSGSQLTGLDSYRKNFIINGACRIKTNADYTLIKNVYGTSVDRFDGMATGTEVSAGTLTQISNWAGNRYGYAIVFDNCTLTGTGEIYLRHRLYSRDAINFKDIIGSFSMLVEHNVGASVPYTIYINKADAQDDFSTVTEIVTSGSMGISTGTVSSCDLESISFGDCSNGLEILIKIECGAITLKDFIFGDLQLEINTVKSNFEYKNIEEDIAMNNYDSNDNFFTKEITASGRIKDKTGFICPVGEIKIYGGTVAPDGFLMCNGTLYSTTTYADLFAVIGYIYGGSAGNFNVPDMREALPVGIGTRESGIAEHDIFTLGQFKDDQMQGHKDTLAINNSGGNHNNDKAVSSQILGGFTGYSTATTGMKSLGILLDDGANGTPRTGTTTRGKAIGLNYIIKY